MDQTEPDRPSRIEGTTQHSPDEIAAPRALKAWANQFQKPAIDTLISECACGYVERAESTPDQPTLAPIAPQLHEAIGAMKGVRCVVRWQGHAWKWAVTYRHSAIPRNSPAEFGYLIPSPDSLRMCVPLDLEMLEKFKSTDELCQNEYLHKCVIDAARPNSHAWPEWIVGSDSHRQAILALVQWKHRVLNDSKKQ